jgi:tRNA G10  N-methylase Trm11
VNPPILAATPWPTNADLIADCERLGYLRADAFTLDPTYGRGTWWRRWRPDLMVEHDIRLDGVDFRDLPHDGGHFRQIAFDPPYVSIGGRNAENTGMGELHDRYGMATTPTSPAGLQALICDGLKELDRVLSPGGVLLVKCQDYVSSGKLWLGTHWTLGCALALGLTCIDRLEHYSPNPRPQPPGRRQVHARRNLSTLFVLRKGK